MVGLLAQWAQVKKALASALAVLISLESIAGWSTTTSQVVKVIIAVLAAFGITYQVTNKPPTPAPPTA